MPCVCPAPNALCKRAGVEMVGRLWELCSGHNCTQTQSDAYRRLWDEQAGIEGVDRTPPIPLTMQQKMEVCKDCEYLLGIHCDSDKCPKCSRSKRVRAKLVAWEQNKCPEGKWHQPSSAGKQLMQNTKKLAWAYGVTTTASRLKDTLPHTIRTLTEAGFASPHLFIDGSQGREAQHNTEQLYLPYTTHWPAVYTVGNWVLALIELYFRKPNAERFALFQDDISMVKDACAYIESCEMPKRGYLNLYTMPENEVLAEGKRGWYRSNQKGKGAQALVFTQECVTALLASPHLAGKPTHSHGHRNLDGMLAVAMRAAGFSEWVHYPSLVQHTGRNSSMGNTLKHESKCFPGESWSALEMLSDAGKQSS